MKITAEIPDLTPEQLAECFWSLDDSQQAKFFDYLGVLALSTPTPFTKNVGSYFGFDMQMCYAAEKSSGNALRIMDIIGSHARYDTFEASERMQPYLVGNQKMPEIPAKKGLSCVN